MSVARAIIDARPADDVEARVHALDWAHVKADLDGRGFSVLKGLIGANECDALAALYPDDALFRTHIVMARHGFGRGEYKYFATPLPDLIGELRAALYSPLASIANGWNEAMGLDVRYPAEHSGFLERCRAAGQTRPTPLLLKYGPGDYNCLHQDLYGEHVFPLQVAILLSELGRDFTGGEFVLTEQRPRMQPRASVAARPGRCGGIRRTSPPGAGHEGRLSRQSQAWRERGAVGPAVHDRYHLPRRQVRMAA